MMINVQLANTYDPAKNYRVSSWFASPKFDGVRAVFIPGSGFFTRNNKSITGFERMAEILDGLCTERGLSFVDGELVLHGRSFQASQSAILASSHPEKSKVEYHVFAVGGGFINTADMLNALPDRPEDNIFRVNLELIPNTFEAVEMACGKFTAQGYEGVVLRNPDTPYHEGRSNHLLKHKFFMEADLRIVAAHEGTGKYAGMLGSITVEGEIGGKRIRSDAGTGLTVEDRKTLFTDSGLIGKVITVKYQALTDKPDREGFYSLRFPAVIGLKEDRDFPAATVSTKPKTHTGTGLPTGKYGFVEATFQVQFVHKPMRRPSYLPSKSEMAKWKSKLYRCRSVQEGTQLIADLRLTIPKIMAFAKYLGVRLKGCKYLKAEIVRWVIGASLVARLRADAVMKAILKRKEAQNEGFFRNKKGESVGICAGGQPSFVGGLDTHGHLRGQSDYTVHSWMGVRLWRAGYAGLRGLHCSGECVGLAMVNYENAHYWYEVRHELEELKVRVANFITLQKLDEDEEKFAMELHAAIKGAVSVTIRALKPSKR